nr:RNA-directed DNA polymerase, eukaryota [Tanacetum cinerariifolium]
MISLVEAAIHFDTWEGLTLLVDWLGLAPFPNCTEDCKVKFATGSLTEDALSWWNSYAKPIGIEQADKIAWTELKRLLTNKYCLRTEVKKIEDEFYNLVVKGNDLKTYTRIFKEIEVLCPNMLDNIKSIQLNDDDLILVDDSSTVVLIKVKEIETISNMYHVCQAEGFVDVKIHYVGGLWVWLQFSLMNSCEAFKSKEFLNKLWTFIKVPSPSFVVDERVIWIEVSGLPLCAWGSSAFKKIANLFGKFNFFDDDVEDSMCMGRTCITTKIQSLISEKVNFTIKDLNFNIHVKEICTWSTLISNDMDSNESDDDHDMEEHRSTNEDVDQNAVLDDFIQQNIVKESALKDSKEGDQANVSTYVAGDNETLFSGKVKEEYFVTKEDKPSEEDVSDTSKPPGFENFIKENSECSISSNASRSDHDMEEHISTNEDIDPNAALDEFIQLNIVKESALNDSKEGDQANVSTHVAGDNETLFSRKVKEEYFVTKEDKPSEEDVSDMSKLLVLKILSSKIVIFHSWFDRTDFEKVVKDKWDDITGEVIGLAYDEDKSSRISKLQELDYFEKMNSLDLMQKARVKWEVERDENSKFFHGFINSRRKSQSIHGIMHEGVWLSDPKEIKEAFLNFYKKKFSCHDSQVSFPSFMPSHHLNTSDQDLLEAAVSMEEIKMAIWDCDSRQILDGPLIISEIIDWYKKRKKKLMLFKLDFEKAFDSLGLLFSSMGVLLQNSLSSENQNDMENITRILNIFYIASGLKINFHKSNVFGVGVSKSEVVSMAACTGCEAGSFPFSYLGLPIGSNMSRIANWQILIDRFKVRLSGWKANLLSIGGRLTLIKSMLGSLGIDLGGCQTSGSWAKIVGTINHLHSSGIVPLNSIRFKVEDGSSIYFWKDTWLGNAPLYIGYNRLFHLENNKDCFINVHISSIFSDKVLYSWGDNEDVARKVILISSCLLEDIDSVTKITFLDESVECVSIDFGAVYFFPVWE